MKIQVAVLMGIQAVYEVDVQEDTPGHYIIVPMLNGDIDIKSTCIAGSSNALATAALKDQVVKSAEQALATMVGENYKPAEKNNGNTAMVPATVN